MQGMAVATLPTLPSPFAWQDAQIAGALPGARFVFSTRLGGVSSGPYASLNLGRLTQDPDEHVVENRRRLAAVTGHPWARVCYGRQVHGATVRRATEPPGPARRPAEEDGQAIADTDLAALVFVADCLPIVLAGETAVAALHGGWRPLAAGIVENGVDALRELGATEIHAALGPSARGCCYEVGEEVHERFARYDARTGARNLDLATVATRQLEAAGVTQVHDVGLCTMCWFGLFFSHRRDGGVTGRQAGVVWRA
jgi:purine-nucleoside/S-methyl-5'-thioadenosine phosphorylase / adenosine deaminase